MNLFETILSGIIHGITEFLPVSSSGHLAIFKQLLGMEDIGMLFDILLHLGMLAAVFAVYWRDIIRLAADAIGICIDAVTNAIEFIRCKRYDDKPKYRRVINSAYRKFAMLVIVSAIPTGIIGVLSKKFVEDISTSLIAPGICLLITATILLISDSLTDGEKSLKKTSYRDAAFIGICQGIAALPGLSRTGTTITAGIVCGMKREFAVKYSFIMSVPVIVGGLIFKLNNFGSEKLSNNQITYYIVGGVIAGIVGYVFIKILISVILNRKFIYFAGYCYIIGTIAILGSFFI